MHSAANILLASLAVSDFTVGLVVEPLFITLILNLITDSTTKMAFEFFSIFLCSASFCTTTAIAIDRLLALQLHLTYEAVVTPFRVTWAVIFIWISPGVLSCVRLWIANIFYITMSTVTFSLLGVNFVVYLKIYLIVRRHQSQIVQEQQQLQQQQIHDGNILWRLRKSAVNTFLVFIVLVCCYMPHSIAVMGLNFSPLVYGITGTILVLNSALNPLLYCWRIREIRTAMKHYFRFLS